MTEEQFWNSNPRIIKVWEKAYKEKTNHENHMNYVLGGYVLDAVYVAIGKSFQGTKFKDEYPKKPVQIFELTAEEKEKEKEKALQQAIAFFNGMKSDYKKAGDTVGGT